MEFRDSFTIPAEPERVWASMFDPDVMRQVLPGCRRLEQVDPVRFEVTLAAGIGALRGVFTGSVDFGDLDPPRRCALDVEARGSLGRVSGRGVVNLTPDGIGTILVYDATFTFKGPMAGLGETLMRSVASALTREAMARFSALVTRSSDGTPVDPQAISG
ncbi:MAG: carbon monoxide dehydrogenase subunit G [Chloroflexota bacterium]